MTLRYPERIIRDMQNGAYEYAPNHLDFPMQPNAQVAIIYHPHYFDQDQLYNTREDYWEQHNLINDPRYAEKAAELREQMTLQLQKFDHPYPLERQEYLETEEFGVLVQKTYDLGTDFIYWWDPENRELPPVTQ